MSETLFGFPVNHVDSLPLMEAEISFGHARERRTMRLEMRGGLTIHELEVDVEESWGGMKMHPTGAVTRTEYHGAEAPVHSGSANARAAELAGLITREHADVIVRWARIQRRRMKAAGEWRA